MKKRAKLLAAVMLASLAFGAMNVSAADERLGTVVGGSLLTEGTSAEITVNPLTRGTFLNNGTGSISQVGVRTVNAGGTTTTYYAVDKVQVKVSIQKLVGNTWVTAVTVPTKTAYNDYYVSQSKSYSVTGGYYYRVCGAHIAEDGSAYESTASYTNGIWID